MKHSCICNTPKNYEKEIIFNSQFSTLHYLRSILLAFFVLAGITSCNDDEEDRKDYYPTDITLGIIDGCRMLTDQDWQVEVDNPEIIDITMNESDLNITPKALGTTKFLVFDGNKKELFRMNVNIIPARRSYRIDSLSTTVEVVDESYKAAIEKEMETLYPHGVGTFYELVYYTKNDGELSIHPAGEENSIEGTLFDEQNDSIIFRYNGLEQRYLTNIVVDKNNLQPNYEDIEIYFIKDYTLYFRNKYPQAGVFRVNGKQITKLPPIPTYTK